MIDEHLISRNKNLISVLELKRLLFAIADNHLNASFRYRLIGQMWQPNFFRVIKVTDKEVFLNDPLKNTLVALPDLSQLMQFEIDAPVYNFLPHNHYEIDYLAQ
jgi:hypothetical protein